MSQALNSPPQAHIELDINIRPATEADIGYCLGSWREALMTAPGNSRLPKGAFRRAMTPLLSSILKRSEVIGAYLDTPGEPIAGWIAVSRGRRLPTVHWVHTRFRDQAGNELRRRGIMTALLDAANVAPRFVYTFRGTLPRHRHPGEQRTTTDTIVARWLASRGVTAVHVPFKEWFA